MKSPFVIAAACVALAAACVRREVPDERTPLDLGTATTWSYATHPILAADGATLLAWTREMLSNSSHFSPVDTAGITVARASVAIVDVTQGGGAGDELTSVRVRVEITPPLADAASTIIASGLGRSRGRDAAAAKAAYLLATSRAFDEARLFAAAAHKSVEELLVDVQSADPARSRTAVSQLAARHHPAAYGPLAALLALDDEDESLRALGELVMLGDRRYVAQVVEIAGKRSAVFQKEVLFALGTTGGDEAAAYLYAVETGHADARMRSAAHEALDVATRRAGSKPAPGSGDDR